MNTALIEAHGLQRKMAGKPVLRDISLNIRAGETLGLVGRNGAGKTTLLRCLLGLAFPDGGEARVFGESAASMSAQAKSRLGYVAQGGDVPALLSGKELLDMMEGWQPNWSRPWANELVQRFAVPLQTRADKLSGGERQLLALVLAMGHRPDLLVLDEPVASLDPVVRREVAATLAELQADHDTAIVFSTHVLSDLERLASHLAVLEEGGLPFLREADSIKQDVLLCLIAGRQGPVARPEHDGILSWRPSGMGSVRALIDTSRLSLDVLRRALDADIESRALNVEDFVVEYLQ
ncbi:ABC transporter ATP-binding protein [Uliginosibacterium sp. H1]|uniref:ABC transporter ATP-binding protein n=1 Tax=Uliginosibacterium sp. H1 TaxID=3114757 RepID=UPI002E190CD6|nr:ABC transporter ATP-binding protein [Uliginosibacterium sp. H1]